LELSAGLSAGGYLYVAIPDHTFYQMDGEDLDFVLGSNLKGTCQDIVTKTDLYGIYISTFKIKLDKSYSGGSKIAFTITSGLRNKFVAHSDDSHLITVQSQDS